MARRSCRLSSTEVLLTVLVVLLVAVCVGLIVVSWLALNKDGEGDGETGFTGELVISNGTVFTEELLDGNSAQFKALAYDIEHRINEAYSRSSLKEQFKSSKVITFREGSVVVGFNVLFRGVLESNTAQEQLVDGLKQSEGEDRLIIDIGSVQVSDKSITTTQRPSTSTGKSMTTTTTQRPSTTTTTDKSTTTTQRPSTTKPVICLEGQKACADGKTCIPQTDFCDGIPNCPDGSDENQSVCATVCDGQFLLLGPTGSFHFPDVHDGPTACRWIIRVTEGLAIKIVFHTFDMEQDIDFLELFQGIGPMKSSAYYLSGTSPGDAWLLSHEATVELSTGRSTDRQGFSASYMAVNVSAFTNEEKINCSFEEDFCLWRKEMSDDGEWFRAQGATFPPDSGPSFDHTTGNQSGHYIVTPRTSGNFPRRFRIHSLPLNPTKESMCLQFWYHMFGQDVRRLMVTQEDGSSVTVLFQKEGNYGDNWNYGQATLNITADTVVFFEARKSSGLLNDIALDDISIVPGSCKPSLPDPTPVPPPTTPPGPEACGKPVDLYEPNSTFSSPNYPNGYGNDASCVWTLHAKEGQNIQLHFQDVALEMNYDVLEIRDGLEPDSDLLGVLTGDRSFPDLFSTTSQMTVMLFTDSNTNDRGFQANFSTGMNLGQPDPCPAGQFQCGTGACVSSASVCDGAENCPDGSDEADCVHIIKDSVTGTEQLRLQVQNTLYTACAENWTPQLSEFFCRYLGYRSGDALFSIILDGDGPFTTVNLNTNGSLVLKPSDACIGGKIVSLHCNNEPCGVRKVPLKSETDEEMERNQVGKVVGGQDAQRGAWPWMVSLHWQGVHVCGAALIDREWLITAAHCIYGKNVHLSNWAAVLGLHSQFEYNNPNKRVHLIDRVIMHNRYNRRTKESDFALMHLQTPATYTDYIQPICLPDPGAHFEEGRKCVVAGWGLLSENGNKADVLQEAVVPLISNTQCQGWLPEYNITDRILCAGYEEGGVDSCKGDSGGPLMCEEGGHWVLVGATSFGIGCARPQRPGAYARVSQFIDWVVENRRLYSDWKGL